MIISNKEGKNLARILNYYFIVLLKFKKKKIKMS